MTWLRRVAFMEVARICSVLQDRKCVAAAQSYRVIDQVNNHSYEMYSFTNIDLTPTQDKGQYPITESKLISEKKSVLQIF